MKKEAKRNPAMEVRGKSLWIRIPPELDHHSADRISVEADELVRTREVQEIVFDFSQTTFCDSSGIGMLMGRYKIMQALGGRVRAVGAGGRVTRILTLSGVTKIIPAETEGGTEK